ncbi:MAG: exonuclease SbcCD subunit D [Lachnospiraceae bacterium]|nr:exonuclease SbcCD subunit D [Lachnospiraceae bacterium]
MKLFHLSDLHLGIRVNEFSMIEDQEYILKEILTLISRERPDAVLVAGDVYDRAVPSEEAMKLWDDFLSSLAGKQVPVFAIYGNHDSAVRFSDHGRLMLETGIRLCREYRGSAGPYTLKDEHGDVNIYMLPFIKPAVARSIFPDEKIESYTDAVSAAVRQMDIDRNARNVLICHQFVTGAQRSESEDVVVGGLDNVDVSVFEGFDYVALGHIHGPQHIGRETVRYCGTPLKYSFSEKDHIKSVTVVMLGEKGRTDIRTIPLVPRHDLRQIRGTYDELTLKENFEKAGREDYIHAVLTDEEDVIDAASKLRLFYPNLMKLSYDNRRTREQRDISDAVDVEKKTPMELFGEFYEKQNNCEMSDDQKVYMQKCIEDIWGA